MRGPALVMISSHRAGSPTFTNNVHWWSYCDSIIQIFCPASESQPAKSEFAAYRQAPREDVFAYVSTKFASFDAAYGADHGDFDILLNAVIDGLYSREVKY